MAETPRPDWLPPNSGSDGISRLMDNLGGAGGIMQAVGMNPDQMFWNYMSGNPYGHQQARFGGRPVNPADVILQRDRDDWFRYSNKQSEAYRQQSLQGMYQMLGFNDATAARRSQNAMDSIYSPAGMVSSLAMLAHDVAGADKQFSQGLLAMNMYAPSLVTADLDGGTFNARQRSSMKRAATAYDMLQKDYFDDVNGFGGLNLRDTSSVFSEMAQRGTIGSRSMDTDDKAKKLVGRVKDMSKAVGAMQELFGGSIPEVMDRLDAVFGGTTSAMSGTQLHQRVAKLKQTSMITGQSLQSVAQMMMVGGNYAAQAGFDEGVGAAAAEETALGMGVNVADYMGSPQAMRRVNMGRVRAVSLQRNVAAATSRSAQYFSGALQLYKQNNAGKTSEDFLEAVRSGPGGLTGLAQAAGEGVSIRDVQNMSMSEEAQIAMSDDPTVTRYASGQSAQNNELLLATYLRANMNRLTGKNLSTAVFRDKDGKLKSREDIVKTLMEDHGISRADASGGVGATYNAVARSQGFRSGSELEAANMQQRGIEELRGVRDARSAFSQKMSSLSMRGGAIGILDYLRGTISDEDYAKLSDAEKKEMRANRSVRAGKVGELFGAVMGSISADELTKGAVENLNAQGKHIALEVLEATKGDGKDQSPEAQRRRRVGLSVLNNLQSVENVQYLKGKGKKAKAAKARFDALAEKARTGDLSTDELEEMAYLTGDKEHREKMDMLKGSGFKDDFDTAEDNASRKEALRDAAAAAAIDKADLTADQKTQAKGILRKSKGKQAAYDALSNATGLESLDVDEIKEQARENEVKLGAAPAMGDMPVIMSKLVEVLEQLANKE